jgi:phosphoglycolate phosphatase-like HAD superfamily hydrolase
VHRLLLWDIDGTLIRSNGIGRRAMETAAAHVGQLTEVPQIVMSGKTDPQILREIFTMAALADDHIDGILPEAMAAAETALAAVEAELREVGHAMPGVIDVLERLAAMPGVRQTLLTGNLAANAAVKVAAFGLEHFFDAEVGAYGTDHADRLELVPIALERVARFRGGAYEPSDVWVIGDTPNDLACARAGGVRCLIIGTEFGQLDADAQVEGFDDTDHVVRILAES